MKVVILAGGYGTRLSEETKNKPKPLIEIGGMPILWHIIKYYESYGFNDFVICLGYKGEKIVEFFATQFMYNLNSYKNSNGLETIKYTNKFNNCKITLAETGQQTMTGGRLKKIAPLIQDETFLLTYGDTLSNVNINKSIFFHKAQKVKATLTTINPQCKYGVLSFGDDQNKVKQFREKPIEKSKWVNGGYYIFEPDILGIIHGDETSLEHEPLQKLAVQNQLAAYRHSGFWSSMETYKDKLHLENLWNSGNAEWAIWTDSIGKVL